MKTAEFVQSVYLSVTDQHYLLPTAPASKFHMPQD